MTPEVEQRFWDKVKKTDSCWIWKASYRGNGYGGFRWNGKMVSASRASWIIKNGEIPRGEGYHGLCVLHRCDNRRCVRPDHLFLGTNKDNVLDCWRKGRSNFWKAKEARVLQQRSEPFCKRDHLLSGNNLYLKKNGTRMCKSCCRIAEKKYREKVRVYGR